MFRRSTLPAKVTRVLNFRERTTATNSCCVSPKGLFWETCVTGITVSAPWGLYTLYAEMPDNRVDAKRNLKSSKGKRPLLRLKTVLEDWRSYVAPKWPMIYYRCILLLNQQQIVKSKWMRCCNTETDRKAGGLRGSDGENSSRREEGSKTNGIGNREERDISMKGILKEFKTQNS